jgi:hypothetical protein
LSPRQAVIVAAYQRGWSYRKIAFAAGVSPQAIEQTINKSGIQKREGGSAPFRRGRRNGLTTSILKCETCRRPFRIPTKEALDGARFCSQLCWAETRKAVPENDIRQAIQMRFSNQTWDGISKALKWGPPQSVQKRIWHRLFLDRMLTPDLVDRIWRPVPGIHLKGYSVAHLERNSGIVPSKDGGTRIAGWHGRKVSVPKASRGRDRNPLSP